MSAEDDVIAVVDDTSSSARRWTSCWWRRIPHRALCVGGRVHAGGNDHARRLPGGGRRLGGTSGPQLLQELPARGLASRDPDERCGNPAIRRRAAELGCMTFLLKPFAPTDLLETLARTLAFGSN